VAFVLAMVAWHYDADTGFTSLIRFGALFDEGRLPALEGQPLHVFPNPGYDGQFYAQLAVDPDVSKPEVQAALDNPRYRARRILLPAIIHVLGAGNTWLTLNIFALANLAVWLALGWLLWRRTRADGWRGAAVWLACMLSLGALDSVRMSLTDLPAMLLIFLAVEASARGRRWPALAAIGAAALTRESSVLAFAAPEGGDLRASRTWVRHAVNGLIIVAPLALWFGWLLANVSGGDDAGTRNFALPFAAIFHHVVLSAQEIAAGNLSYRHLFGLIAVPGFLLQAAWVLRRVVSRGFAGEPWIRAAAPFALLLLVLGESVWFGSWSVARACLPLTFAFNLTLPRDGRFWWWFAIGNAFAVHGIHRMLPG
jgi:hypothetical protein